MSDSTASVNVDSAVDQASVWVARLDRGLTSEERAELRKFLSSSDARRAFLELAALNDELNQLAGLSPASVEPASTQRHRAHGLARRGMMLAASLVLAVALGLFGLSERYRLSEPSGASESVVYETRVGERSAVQLTDGTLVSLNTNTRLRVSFSGRGRLAILDRGEAHFDVARDTNRPFSVRSGDYLIQAVGTSFSVYRSRNAELEVIVDEGIVRINHTRVLGDDVSNNELQPPTLMVGGEKLAAGDAATFSSQGKVASLSSMDPILLEARLAWREGKLVFRGESLEDVLADISRYTPLRFEFLDDAARQISVAGVFKTGDVEGLLKSLEANFDIAYQRFDDELILIGIR